MRVPIGKAQLSFPKYEQMKRSERAKELEEPIQISDTLFAVASSKKNLIKDMRGDQRYEAGERKTPYLVRRIGDKWICDCPDSQFRKEENLDCKHIEKVKKFLLDQEKRKEEKKHTAEAKAKIEARKVGVRVYSDDKGWY